MAVTKGDAPKSTVWPLPQGMSGCAHAETAIAGDLEKGMGGEQGVGGTG